MAEVLANININPASFKPDFDGYLMKQSMWLKQWRKRYFSLKGNKLYFATSSKAHPHGVINLQECLTVKSSDKIAKRFCFELSTPETTYYICADSEEDKDKWIRAIGRAIVKFSNSFQEDE